MAGILLPACAIFFSGLLCIIYFSKKRVNLLENTMYSVMIISILMDSILVTILQSFPNGFEFCGKSDDIYRQIGEAVPPMLSLAIAASVLIELLSGTPTEAELAEGAKSIIKPVSSSYSSVIAGIKTRGRSKK